MEIFEKDNRVSKDDVIAKLKDDGDFDRLRLKIIHKLKDNEELRNNIMAMVKQSAALHRAGAESMKPRQLSDAIYEDVGSKIMGQISDGLWEIIRSGDGMKNEISETVQMVYKKLLHPEVKEEGESSNQETMPLQKAVDSNCSLAASVTAMDETVYDNEPNEPPGFSLPDNHLNNNHDGQGDNEQHIPIPSENEPEHMNNPQHSSDDVAVIVPPGFSAAMEQKLPCECSDEDPELPPGFA